MSAPEGHAVLLTGVYGAGKTSVAEEMASMFEERGSPYAAIDLDWLVWFDVGWDDAEAEHGMLVKNLEVIARNYLEAGVRFLVLALSIEHEWQLDAIRAVIPLPLRVARLVVDLETIEERCAGDPTTGRPVDLRWARRWVEGGTGVGFEDFVVANDRPVREVAAEVIERLGW